MPVTTFGPLEIRYDERVLEPRPWTEEQSRWGAELAASAPPGDVLELCAGAGQIGLLLARLSGRRVVAVEAEPVAAAFARGNAWSAGLAPRYEVRERRLEEALAPVERFAVVLADPPWVPRDATDQHPADPLLAIDGGEDGLDVARACLAVVARHLLPGGSALLQLGTAEQARVLVAGLPAHLRREELRTCERGVLLHLRVCSGDSTAT